MKSIGLLLIYLSGSSFWLTLQGQTDFYSSVKIEFEKTVYLRQLNKDLQGNAQADNSSSIPDVYRTYFDFTADSAISVYKSIPTPTKVNFFIGITDQNLVITNFKTGIATFQKTIYDETVQLTDTFMKIRWKITDETRNIAGFDCKKAIGFLDDTVVIYAFFSEEILIRGGPEGISGLPGMILGVGMPQLHSTWFATKVLIHDGNKPIPAVKGTVVDRATLYKIVSEMFKSKGMSIRKLALHFRI